MTNTMDFKTIVLDRHGYISGHTLLFLLLMAAVIVILIFGSVRFWKARTAPGGHLPRKAMFITGILTVAIGLSEALLSLAEWLTIEAIGTPQNDPAAYRSLLDLAVARQLQMLCVPLVLSALAFSLGVAMGKGWKTPPPPTVPEPARGRADSVR